MESKVAPRAHEILQELRDISTMAIEHFDEKILPELKSNVTTSISTVGSYELPGGSNLLLSHHSSGSTSHTFSQPITPEKLQQTVKKVYHRAKKNKVLCRNTNNRVTKIRLRLRRQAYQMRQQNQKLQDQAKKIHEQEVQLTDMRKYLDEWEQKMGDMTAEFIRARDGSQKTDIIKSLEENSLSSKNLQAKKRKLIVERTSTHAKDVKFKKFMSELLKASDPSQSTP